MYGRIPALADRPTNPQAIAARGPGHVFCLSFAAGSDAVPGVPARVHRDADAFIAGLASAPGMPGTWFQLAVCLNDGGSMIGDIGMHFPGHDEEAGIGYTLSPSYWGRRYMAEALPAVLDYLFRIQAMHRVTASVDPRNLRSVRALERLGMRLEAHHVQSEMLDGQPVDDCLYAMLREEWDNRAMPGCL